MGLDLADHETQPLTEPLVRHADVIFVMSRSHRDAILAQWPAAAARTRLLCRRRLRRRRSDRRPAGALPALRRADRKPNCSTRLSRIGVAESNTIADRRRKRPSRILGARASSIDLLRRLGHEVDDVGCVQRRCRRLPGHRRPGGRQGQPQRSGPRDSGLRHGPGNVHRRQ